MAKKPVLKNRILTSDVTEIERPEHIGLKLDFSEFDNKAYLRFTVEGKNTDRNYIATLFFNEAGKLQMYLNSGVDNKYVETDLFKILLMESGE